MSLVLSGLEVFTEINGTAQPTRRPVIAATTANGTFATDYDNGKTLDGVALATGDRILLKDMQEAREVTQIFPIGSAGIEDTESFTLYDGVTPYTFYWDTGGGTPTSTNILISTALPTSDIVAGEDIVIAITGSFFPGTATFDGVATVVIVLDAAGAANAPSDNITGTFAMSVLVSGDGTGGSNLNGIYEVQASGAPLRAEDYDSGNVAGTIIPITNGTTNGGTVYNCTNTFALSTPDIDILTFASIGGSGNSEGLNVKENAQYATIETIADSHPSIVSTFSYSSVGGPAGTGQITAVLTASNAFTVDGGLITSTEDNTRILLKDQTDAKQNGIYYTTIVGTALTLTRTTDYDEDSDISDGDFVYVREGTVNKNIGYVQTTDDQVTLNTDNIVWAQFSSIGSLTGGDGIDISTGTISADLKTSGGIIVDTGQLQVDLTASAMNGLLPATSGGTGQSGYAIGDLLYAGSTTTLVKLTAVATGSVLSSNGASTAPIWSLPPLHIMVQPNQISANNNTPQNVAFFNWDEDIYGAYTALTVTFFTDPNVNRTVTVEVYNETAGTTMGNISSVGTTPQSYTIAATSMPSADSYISVKVNKNVNGGSNPQIYGIQFILS